MNFNKYHVSKNLFDKDNQNWKVGYRIDDEGNEVSSQIAQYSQNRIEVNPNSKYTAFGFYPDGTSLSNSGFKLYCYDANDIWIENISASLNSPKEFTMPNDCHYIRLQVTTAYYAPNTAMINTGSTPLPYEPYGYLWSDIPHYIHNTSTDTITTLPADLYADGNNATVGISGNTVQNGTPTPDNPIMPHGTGERTGNLCNPIPYKNNYYISENGVETRFNGFDIYKVAATAQTKYTLSLNTSLSRSTVRIHSYSNGSWAEQIVAPTVKTLPITFTTPQDCDEIRFSITNDALNHIMLNEGSIALPFEPSGYKITISSANTTTPVYLGEVESTRRIKKYELTGEENWELHSTQANLFRLLNFDGYLFELKNILVCNAYESVVNGGAADVGDKQIGFYFNTGVIARILYIRDSSYSTVSDFKTYLQQQYAAGTPVTIWYVLAAETTGIVNEPLMKIGDYADTVSGITIPTIAGANSFDVLTTLKPSEVTVNYKGWHSVADVHERENGQWN